MSGKKLVNYSSPIGVLPRKFSFLADSQFQYLYYLIQIREVLNSNGSAFSTIEFLNSFRFSLDFTRPGTMMAVIGIEERALAEICKQNDTVIANYNCLGQLVISSAGENIARAAESAKAGGAARTIPLTGERRFPLSLDATGR